MKCIHEEDVELRTVEAAIGQACREQQSRMSVICDCLVSCCKLQERSQRKNNNIRNQKQPQIIYRPADALVQFFSRRVPETQPLSGQQKRALGLEGLVFEFLDPYLIAKKTRKSPLTLL